MGRKPHQKSLGPTYSFSRLYLKYELIWFVVIIGFPSDFNTFIVPIHLPHYSISSCRKKYALRKVNLVFWSFNLNIWSTYLNIWSQIFVHAQLISSHLSLICAMMISISSFVKHFSSCVKQIRQVRLVLSRWI